MDPTRSARLRTWRHHLHRHPETAFAEHATVDYLAAQLESLGYAVERGIGGTGAVASLTRGTSSRAVGSAHRPGRAADLGGAGP